MSETRTDTASALFLLAGALRGRAPEGPPPPRVLDVLVFARAQVRFRTVSAAAAGAGGELPWRVPDGGPAQVESGAREAIFVHGETQPAPGAEATVVSRASEERPSAPAVAASAPVATRDIGQEAVPAPALRFRQPALPAAAPVVSAEPERDRGDAVVDARSPLPGENTLPKPVVFGAVPPGAALPFAVSAAVPSAVVLTETLAASSRDVTDPSTSSAQSVPPQEPTPAAPALRLDLPAPDLPWADPLRLEPPVPPRRPTAPNGGAAWRFVPSPARSAAETAVRVASAESDTQQETSETPVRPVVAEQPRLRAAGEPPLTAGGLLREVTRDEVVRALAERMRTLARDDRFRLGELR